MKSTPICPLVCVRVTKDEKSSAGTKKYKCYQQGPVVRNSFFNFLREIRKTHCGLSIIEIAKKGGEMWRKMSEQEKCKYMREAYCAPKYIRKERRRRKMRQRGQKSSRRQ